MADSREHRNVHPGDVIPLQDGTRTAIKLYAPHLGHITHGKVISYTLSLVISVEDEVVIKRGGSRIQKEVAIMKFASERFSIPVPKIFGLHTDPNGWVFLVMECVKGQPLHIAWRELKQVEKEQVVADLKEYVDRMRLLSGSYIGSLNREPFPEGHAILKRGHCGPFESEEEFNEALLIEFDEYYKYHTPVIKEMLRQKSGHRIVFAHGDLQTKNVLVHGRHISAIVDWEFAGFYPEYWEYALAWLILPWSDRSSEDWPAYLQKSMDPYPLEAAVVSIIATCNAFGV